MFFDGKCDCLRNRVAPIASVIPSTQIIVRTIAGATGEMNLFG